MADNAGHAGHEPYCLAMVLCDGVHQDPQTGKYTLLGTFHAIRTKDFPAVLQFAVYFAITDCIGIHEIRVQLVSADEHLDNGAGVEPIFSIATDMEFDDPLAVGEGILTARTEIASPGVYHCELYADDVPLMSRRLVVQGPPALGE